MKDLLIVGSGGFAREVAFLVDDINRQEPQWNLLGYVASDAKDVGQSVGKYPVVCSDDDLRDREAAVVIGIGQPPLLRRIAEKLLALPNLSFPSLVHPSVIWDRERIALGQGNIVCAGNIFTTDIRIGSFNVFNLSSTYGHDVAIGSYCVFNPGVNLSGSVTVGDECLVGTGATVLQSLEIGAGALVGAGSLVLKSVPPDVTVAGVPARVLEGRPGARR